VCVCGGGGGGRAKGGTWNEKERLFAQGLEDEFRRHIARGGVFVGMDAAPPMDTLYV
jgi:hypothetical protein